MKSARTDQASMRRQAEHMRAYARAATARAEAMHAAATAAYARAQRMRSDSERRLTALRFSPTAD
ncbi:hypothetical protein ACIREE_37690 [Streptomyces sp. NPDC102467]|uniref:hypothetical protein n=1 Tax=Streptomyces sp. NPDC102467 TaxID=3366179 RepID=UPI00382A6439